MKRLQEAGNSIEQYLQCQLCANGCDLLELSGRVFQELRIIFASAYSRHSHPVRWFDWKLDIPQPRLLKPGPLKGSVATFARSDQRQPAGRVVQHKPGIALLQSDRLSRGPEGRAQANRLHLFRYRIPSHSTLFRLHSRQVRRARPVEVTARDAGDDGHADQSDCAGSRSHTDD